MAGGDDRKAGALQHLPLVGEIGGEQFVGHHDAAIPAQAGIVDLREILQAFALQHQGTETVGIGQNHLRHAVFHREDGAAGGDAENFGALRVEDEAVLGGIAGVALGHGIGLGDLEPPVIEEPVLVDAGDPEVST